MKGCWKMVFQQQRRTSKQVLDGVVSAMKIVRKWRGWEEMKNDEQWCFSIETMMKGCWQSVFQQREENERLLVFQQREKLLLMVFQQWKGKNETSAGRSCFGNKNGGEMADWNVLGMGRNEKYVEQWCFSIVKITGEGLLTLVFQQRKKKSETIVGRSCFGNEK
jgi:hypothetical protein